MREPVVASSCGLIPIRHALLHDRRTAFVALLAAIAARLPRRCCAVLPQRWPPTSRSTLAPARKPRCHPDAEQLRDCVAQKAAPAQGDRRRREVEGRDRRRARPRSTRSRQRALADEAGDARPHQRRTRSRPTTPRSIERDNARSTPTRRRPRRTTQDAEARCRRHRTALRASRAPATAATTIAT